MINYWIYKLNRFWKGSATRKFILDVIYIMNGKTRKSIFTPPRLKKRKKLVLPLQDRKCGFKKLRE